ncbi:hypothetical protein AAG906_032106 [Vitis piasezkii]
MADDQPSSSTRYEPSGNDEWFYFTPRDRKYWNGQRPNSWMTVFYAESIGQTKGSTKDHGMRLGLMNQAHQALRFRDLTLTLILMRSTIHMRRSRCLSKPNSHNLELKYSKPLKNLIILLCKATPNSPSWGNEFGGQGLDNFDIMNGAIGNSSFDAGNGIDFGNVPDWDAAIDFGNVPGFDSTDYGNSGLYRMIDYGNYAFKHEWLLRPAAMVVVIYAGFSGHSSVLV